MEKATGEFHLTYTPALNGIRGIAVLLVIAFHTGLPALAGGFIGVDIFFVLSGFLITAILIGEHNRYGKINFKFFYIRRALRLFPALALLVASYIVIGSLIVETISLTNIVQEALYAIFYIANIVLAFGFDSIVFLGHAWSLSMEEQFYLVWPLILLVLLNKISNRYKLFVGITLLTVMAWAYRAHMLSELASPTINRIFYGPDTRADGLLTGCALAILISTGFFEQIKTNRFFTQTLKCLALIAFVALLYLALIVRIGDPSLYYWQLFALGVCVATIILDSQYSENSWIKYLLEIPLLVWIGRISYGLYLWHFLVFNLLSTQGLSPINILLLGIPLTFSIAVLSFYMLETRFLELQKSFKPGN